MEIQLIRETIITAMQRRELTAYALGKLAGVDPGVVKRFVDGKLQIKSDNLDLLCAALNLELRLKPRPPRKVDG